VSEDESAYEWDQDREDEGCTCGITPAPCGYCENTPDPDNEAGLRRTIRELNREIQGLKHRPPGTVKMLLEQFDEMKVIQKFHIDRIASLESQLLTKPKSFNLSYIYGMFVALACVGQLAAERSPIAKGSARVKFLEID
jgi:hypothetical protein